MSTPTNGLTASIYKNPTFKHCSNGGISARCDEVTVVGLWDGRITGVAAPPVIIESHHAGCLRAVPAEWDAEKAEWVRAPGCWMMGGSFVHTSDSRFGAACERALGAKFYGAVALHDRKEYGS